MSKFFRHAATLALLGLVLGTPQARAQDSAEQQEVYRQLDRLGDIISRIRSDYVEAPDMAKLIEAGINGMLAKLDPHSHYISAKSFQDMQVQTRGEFAGLGLELTLQDGVPLIVTVIEETVSEKAGLLANDQITHVDGEHSVGLTLMQFVKKLRGPVNSPVTLTIKRAGKSFDVTLVREIIPVRTVRQRAEGDIGYIRLTSFNEQTQSGLERAVDKLRQEIGDVKGYILDLRNNPGGLLDQAISVSDAFLERGGILMTRGRSAEHTQRYHASAGDLTDGKPLAVLINGGSAAASEIVAAALQDHKRAIIIGTRTFGRGTVQTIIPLGSNGAMRLTTASYFTPGGSVIQDSGVQPDKLVKQNVPADVNDGLSTYVPVEKSQDTQLTAALELLRSR